MENTPGTVPAQPQATPPMKKGMPIVLGLGGILAVLALANVGSLMSGNKREAPRSAMPMRPATANAQQVSSFQPSSRARPGRTRRISTASRSSRVN